MLLTRTLARKGAELDRGVARPQLTSMIDMMTILLVFLLKSFSVEGDLISTSPDLVLPESSSLVQPEPTLSVEISTQGLSLEGEALVSLAALMDEDAMIVAPLLDRLLRLAADTGREGMENRVTLQCDQGIDFALVKRVMATCAQASYSDFSLLVMREEG